MKKRENDMIAENRLAEATLWSKIARSRPAGSTERQAARGKSNERRLQASQLLSESEVFYGLFGEEL